MGIIKRVDENQAELVGLLRRLGASVLVLSSVGKGCPDILIGLKGNNYLLEIKSNMKSKLTEHEQKFFDTWNGQVAIVRSDTDVIDFLNNVTRGTFA